MILDIGSGPWPKADADVRMDVNDWPGVNCRHDLTNAPYPFAPEQFTKVYMGDVLEHISIFDVDAVLTEVHRIMKPNAVLEVTVPDARWIFERIVARDWEKHANVGWLNPTPDPWKNALAYLFGGFHTKEEYQMPGMGHVNAFDYDSLTALLLSHQFVNCIRVPDMRNPEPARHAVLKVMCYRG